MPFRWDEDDEAKLSDHLTKFARQTEPLLIKLNNFSSFPPRVIFINVEVSPALVDLQKNLQRHCKRSLNLFNANYKELPFRPHLTVAFRDLKKPSYQRAWEEFKKKNFQAEFIADKVTLLKHSGKHWKVHQEFNFQ
jgi:2'-5' RNA ligase